VPPFVKTRISRISILFSSAGVIVRVAGASAEDGNTIRNVTSEPLRVSGSTIGGSITFSSKLQDAKNNAVQQ
jgi:hypothetical protein